MRCPYQELLHTPLLHVRLLLSYARFFNKNAACANRALALCSILFASPKPCPVILSHLLLPVIKPTFLRSTERTPGCCPTPWPSISHPLLPWRNHWLKSAPN